MALIHCVYDLVDQIVCIALAWLPNFPYHTTFVTYSNQMVWNPLPSSSPHTIHSLLSAHSMSYRAHLLKGIVCGSWGEGWRGGGEGWILRYRAHLLKGIVCGSWGEGWRGGEVEGRGG